MGAAQVEVPNLCNCRTTDLSRNDSYAVWPPPLWHLWAVLPSLVIGRVGLGTLGLGYLSSMQRTLTGNK